MKENRATFPLAAMCRVLGLSPSGYYDWLTRPPSDRARRDIELQGKILLSWGGSGETYGCPRIQAELQAAGERVSRKRVARLMRDLGIQGVTRRRFKTTTRKDAKARPAPDLVNRNFSADGPDQLWVADITHVPTWAGWLYLAVVLDAWSRRIVGWAMAPHMRAELVEGALAMAISNRKPKGRVVHHSDRGSQGEFKRSSQHLREELRWRHADADERIELYVHRCVHQAVRRWDAASIGRGSGQRSLEVCRARRPPWQRVCPPLSGRAGFANVVAWHPSSFCPQSRRYLSFVEREEIAVLRARGRGVREIAPAVGPLTLDDLARTAAKRSYTGRQPRVSGHDRSMARRSASETSKACEARYERRTEAVCTGSPRRPDRGSRWYGRAGPRCALDRTASRSPTRPAVGRSRGVPSRSPTGYGSTSPDDESMRISHEAIYQALYVQGRGALRRELTACLRTGRALRVPRVRTRRRGKAFVHPEIMLSERPAEADDRAVPGHWEGDLILGLGSSAIGTLVERTSRFTMLLHLPRLDKHGEPRTKNGPALAGHGAEAVRDAIASSITTLPGQLRRSLTWDQGAEMAQHARLRIDTGLAVYFCDPQSPWQRGTNENTNGLLRQYFPKGTDLSRHTADDLSAVATALNSRPRKTLGWKTPAETLEDLLQSLNRTSTLR